MGRSKNRGFCIYCQARAATTKDHVPPRNLFPPPTRAKIIGVPCCQTCNQAVSKDDEYFRATIINRHDVKRTPIVSEVTETVFRGLAKEKQAGFRNAFLRAATEVEITTPSGIYLGKGVDFKADFDRLEAVAVRTVRGLYHKEFKQALNPNCHVRAFIDIGLKGATAPKDGPLMRVLTSLMGNPRRIIHEQIFEYRFARSNEESASSLWILLFYQSVWFLVLTTPYSSSHPA